MKLPPFLAARWQGVSSRERQLVLAGLALLLLALVWWLGVAPALATLRSAQTQRQLLDAQLQQMQSLQAQAKALQAQPRITFEEARRLLEASIKPFGTTAQLTLAGERASVTLRGASADALAQWLTQVRLNVRSVPSEARLVRNASGAWDGTLTLNLK
ncbi:MAG: type II secretion system protein GspM [Rhodoferax sp.]|uniref:type II secretion system protein GspM n=1 Tax=Rhodoferax sp. TaxID=50421 RepID=UPI0026344863|nr:type II secretion system protein GspM [Rhodoferax sp.]MDD5334639.1 type II secretion system protein GspM [Rhodoferax sp.]